MAVSVLESLPQAVNQLPSESSVQLVLLVPRGLYVHTAEPVAPRYTYVQGQYLAFIHYYTKIHGRPPAEADMQRFFKTSPPTVHQMVVTLERRSLISRTPGQPRTVRVLLSRADLPDFE